MAVFKLSNRKVVVSEGGVTKVLTSPCGVSYSEATERWSAWVIGDQDQWVNRSFGIHKHGAITAFELAVEAREDSLNFLLNRRMLPRIRHLMKKKPNHDTTIRQEGNFFIVRDPLRKNYHKFDNKEDAKTFNIAVTEEWKLLYKFDKLSMVKIDHEVLKKNLNSRTADSFTREFQKAAKGMGLQ